MLWLKTSVAWWERSCLGVGVRSWEDVCAELDVEGKSSGYSRRRESIMRTRLPGRPSRRLRWVRRDSRVRSWVGMVGVVVSLSAVVVLSVSLCACEWGSDLPVRRYSRRESRRLRRERVDKAVRVGFRGSSWRVGGYWRGCAGVGEDSVAIIG